MNTRAFTSGALALVICASIPSCFLDFTEAIPCDADENCPDGFECQVEVNQCVALSNLQDDPDPAPNNDPNNSPNNDPGDVGVEMDMGGMSPDVNVGVPDVDEGMGDGPCPPGTAHVDDVPGIDPFCIDRFEASRPDANGASASANNSPATSRGNVLPWTGADTATAQAACQAAEKRLCSPAEWTAACGGPDGRTYPYSAIQYVVGMCNTSGTLEATSNRPDCVFADYQTFDMSGNVIEIVDSGQGGLALMGGSFGNTTPTQLTCTGDPVNQAPIGQIGFRCCQSL